jgi:hypothetical protein
MPLTDDEAMIEELFLSTLTRPASDEEKKAIVDYLKDRKDRPAALAELVWALLASAEYRFNH